VGGCFGSSLLAIGNTKESHARQWVDAFGSFLTLSRRAVLKIRDDLNNPPTAVGGIYQFWMVRFVESDLNHPPTAVGGIYRFWMVRLVESDLNHPPTAVGGIYRFWMVRFVDSDLNHPPKIHGLAGNAPDLMKSKLRACVSARIL